MLIASLWGDLQHHSLTTSLTVLCQPREVAGVAFFITAIEERQQIPKLAGKTWESSEKAGKAWREILELDNSPRVYGESMRLQMEAVPLSQLHNRS